MDAWLPSGWAARDAGNPPRTRGDHGAVELRPSGPRFAEQGGGGRAEGTRLRVAALRRARGALRR